MLRSNSSSQMEQFHSGLNHVKNQRRAALQHDEQVPTPFSARFQSQRTSICSVSFTANPVVILPSESHKTIAQEGNMFSRNKEKLCWWSLSQQVSGFGSLSVTMGDGKAAAG